MINKNTIVKRADNLISNDIDDETVLLSILNGNYYGLNNVASRIWVLLQNPITVNDLVQCLQNEFEVDEIECETQVLSFLKTLFQNKLIVILNHAQA